jgi:hypothetical protein
MCARDRRAHPESSAYLEETRVALIAPARCFGAPPERQKDGCLSSPCLLHAFVVLSHHRRGPVILSAAASAAIAIDPGGLASQTRLPARPAWLLALSLIACPSNPKTLTAAAAVRIPLITTLTGLTLFFILLARSQVPISQRGAGRVRRAREAAPLAWRVAPYCSS